MSRGWTALAASLAVALIGGCGGGGDGDAVALPADCSKVEAPPAKQVKLAAPSEKAAPSASSVDVETSCGSFTIELDAAHAPKTTSSFAYLVEQGVYNDTLIHRIQPGFVIQGGDPTGKGTGGPGYFVDELPPQNLSYVRGVVAMAKTAAEPPGRSGSQFFVVTAADAGLTPDYALVGKVSDGMDVVDQIEELGTPDGTPKAPVVIRRMTLGAG